MSLALTLMILGIGIAFVLIIKSLYGIYKSDSAVDLMLLNSSTLNTQSGSTQKLKRSDHVIIRSYLEDRDGDDCRNPGFTPKWITGIPPLSPVTSRLVSELRSPNFDVKAVADLVAQDPMLTIELLRMANSAAFAQTRNVTSIEKALSLLGQDAVLAVAIRGMMSGISTPSSRIDQNRMLRHNIATGLIAGALAQRIPGLVPVEAVTAGLLHDIGKLIMHSSQPRKMQTLLDRETTYCGESRLQKEVRFFEITHMEVGALLAEHWGLPFTLVKTIELHHQRTIAHETEIPEEVRKLVCVVFIANQLSKYVRCSGDDLEIDLPSPDILALLNLPDDYESILSEIEPVVSRTLQAFLLDIPEAESEEQIEKRLVSDVSGDLSSLPILNLIQTLSAARREGILICRRADSIARALFEGGKLTGVQCDTLAGEEAFRSLITWKSGEFNFVSESTEFPASAKISRDLMPLMMDSLRYRDERKHRFVG